VRELEDAFAMTSDGALVPRIVATSLAHQVLSRFTGFVAVDRSAVVNPGGAQRTVIQPVELPAGWEQEGARRVRAARAGPLSSRGRDAPGSLARAGEASVSKCDAATIRICHGSCGGYESPARASSWPPGHP
jgi:Ca-activated chloride channel homolog